MTLSIKCTLKVGEDEYDQEIGLLDEMEIDDKIKLINSFVETMRYFIEQKAY